MDRTFRSSEKNELTAEDLIVLRTFHALEKLPGEDLNADLFPPEEPTQILTTHNSFSNPAEEMLILFATEADEDITAMRHALYDLEQDESLEAPGFDLIQRTAHKLKGSAGSIGCDYMSTIAFYIENTVKQVKGETLAYLTGIIALVHAIHALEMTLQSVISQEEESKEPLTELEDAYKALSVDVYATAKLSREEETSPHSLAQTAPDSLPTVRIDAHRLAKLTLHTEQLVEHRLPLESAQKQVEAALLELNAAQGRLRRLEALLSTYSFPAHSSVAVEVVNEEHSPSSLVTRIINEAVQRTGHPSQHKSKSPPPLVRLPEDELWDEMEIDRYTESGVLIHSLGEAIADITTASSQLSLALAHLNTALQQHITQATLVHTDTLSLQSTPVASLAERLRQAIEMIAKEQRAYIQFEVVGEKTEVDQSILEELADPFLHLVRSSVADFLIINREVGRSKPVCSISLYAHAIGSEVIIEIGFSVPVLGGALDAMRDTMSRLNGAIAVQRNTTGGIKFQLRFTPKQGTIKGLLVRSGSQYSIVPFSQIQRIDYSTQDQYTHLYTLNALLGLPNEEALVDAFLPVLILHANPQTIAVAVDEVLGETVMVMKPLTRYLQRPGIKGAAIDGLRNVLLIVDLPELVRQQQMRTGAAKTRPLSNKKTQPLARHSEPANLTVLIADDSVFFRQSIAQILTHAGYTVIEAHDSMEALEKLLEHSIDVLLLDIEMPNLNGYELLSIIRTYPQLASLKIAMLTSRSSQKHQQRAVNLGAHAFLVKPCPQDTLLHTLQILFTS